MFCIYLRGGNFRDGCDGMQRARRPLSDRFFFAGCEELTVRRSDAAYCLVSTVTVAVPNARRAEAQGLFVSVLWQSTRHIWPTKWKLMLAGLCPLCRKYDARQWLMSAEINKNKKKEREETSFLQRGTNRLDDSMQLWEKCPKIRIKSNIWIYHHIKYSFYHEREYYLYLKLFKVQHSDKFCRVDKDAAA